MATGAEYVVTPCHNCHAQIHDLGEHFNGGYHVIHLWTLIALSLGVLADTERVYLGPDLAEVWLPGQPGTPDPISARKEGL